MISFQQARSNPRYSDWSDEELLISLHKKEGGGTPLAEYAPSIGYVSRDPQFNEYAPKTGGFMDTLGVNFTAGMGKMVTGAAGLGAQAAGAIMDNPGLAMIAPGKGEVIREWGKKVYKHVEADLKALDVSSKDEPVAAFIGEMLGEIAVMPLPANVAKTLRGRIAVAMAEGIGVGATVHPGEGETRVGGAVSGMIGAGLVGGAVGTAGKIRGAIQGRMATKKDQLMHDVGKKMGVDLTAGDVGGDLANRLDIVLEAIPFMGTSGKQKLKLEQATKGLKKLKNEYQKIFSKYGTDAVTAIKKGFHTEYLRRKTKGDEFYKKVRTYMGDAHVPWTKINQKAKDMLREELSLKGEHRNQSIVDLAKRYMRDPGYDWDASQKIRTRLKAEMRDKTKFGTQARARLATLSQALDDDFTDAAQKVGGKAAAAEKKAKDFWAKRVIPSKKPFFDVLRDPEAIDSVTAKFMRTRNADNARRMYKALDKEGQAAMKTSIIRHAMDAVKDSDGNTSPVAFAGKLRLYRNLTNAVFTKEERKELKGIQKFMRLLEGASRQGKTPMTGMGAMQTAIGVGTAGAAGVGASAAPGKTIKTIAQIAATTGALRAAFGTDSGRRLIRSAADFGPSKMEQAMEDLMAIAQRAAAVESADL